MWILMWTGLLMLWRRKREEVGDLHSETYTLKLELSSEGRERRETRRRLRGVYKVESRNEEG